MFAKFKASHLAQILCFPPVGHIWDVWKIEIPRFTLPISSKFNVFLLGRGFIHMLELDIYGSLQNRNPRSTLPISSTFSVFIYVGYMGSLRVFAKSKSTLPISSKLGVFLNQDLVHSASDRSHLQMFRIR